MEKELKQIENFKGYFINEIGEVFSNLSGKLKKKKTSKRNYKKTNDYNVVHLMKDKKRYKRFVHRLVYETFVGDIPTGYQIDHINEIKDDNRVENLQLLTQQENIQKYWENKNK